MPSITLTVDAANAARIQAAANDAGAPDPKTWIVSLVTSAVKDAEAHRPPPDLVVT
jgi:hypothetical protein